MNEAYIAHNEELFTADTDLTTQCPGENHTTPPRPTRFKIGQGDNLTPTQNRSPLQTLQESPEGFLFQII